MRYAQQSPMFIMLSQNSGGLVTVSSLKTPYCFDGDLKLIALN
jgi:hypothetical protein